MLLTITGIVLVIVIFMILVVIHELGHFRVAKKSGVKVLEFGIGIPPKIAKITTDASGTEYTINAIPLGGFVRLKGEDPKDTEDFNASDSFISATFRRKTAILLAGIAMNFLFARLVLTIMFSIGTRPLAIIPDMSIEGIPNMKGGSVITPTLSQALADGIIVTSGSYPVHIVEILSGSLSKKMGLQTGDIVTHIGSKPVGMFTIKDTLATFTGQTFAVTYTRSGQKLTGHTTCPASGCLLGISYLDPDILQNINAQARIQANVPVAMGRAVKEIYHQTVFLFRFMGSFVGNLITFQGEAVKTQAQMFSGPVGIAKVVTEFVRTFDITKIILFIAMISIALGAFNLLPIPALDGGRLLGVIIQATFRLRKETYFNIEGYINMVFFILLMLFGVFVMLKDLGMFRGVNVPFMGSGTEQTATLSGNEVGTGK